MCSHEDHSAAPSQRLVVVLEPVLRHEFRNVSLVQFWKVAEFHKKPPQVTKRSPEDLQPLFIRQFRKGHLEVAKARAALAPRQVKSEPGHSRRCAAGHGAGHGAENCEKKSGEYVLDLFFNAAAHPWYFH